MITVLTEQGEGNGVLSSGLPIYCCILVYVHIRQPAYECPYTRTVLYLPWTVNIGKIGETLVGEL
jgi:hypothetical protein